MLALSRQPPDADDEESSDGDGPPPSDEQGSCAPERSAEEDFSQHSLPDHDTAAHTTGEKKKNRKKKNLCHAVLAYRTSAKDATETRYFGLANREFLCGDIVTVDVEWRSCGRGVKTDVDMGVSAEELGAVPIVGKNAAGSCHAELNGAGETCGDRSVERGHDFLIRPGYLMYGVFGNAAEGCDDCIRLDVVEGFGSVK